MSPIQHRKAKVKVKVVRLLLMAGLLGLLSGQAGSAQAQGVEPVVTLHGFVGMAANPSGNLIQGKDGNLYGTTSKGGANGTGVVFRLAPDGSGFTTLYSFSALSSGFANADGAGPSAVIQGSDGNLYGTAAWGGIHGRGTVFRLAPDGSGFTALHRFSALSNALPYSNADGALPTAGLLQGSDGTLYGTTAQGGANGNGGVFRLAPDGSGFTQLCSFYFF